jgi:hypothetical protein
MIALSTKSLQNNHRDGEIRTRDPLLPKQVRYQAAPRPGSWASVCDARAVRPERSGVDDDRSARPKRPLEHVERGG